MTTYFCFLLLSFLIWWHKLISQFLTNLAFLRSTLLTCYPFYILISSLFLFLFMCCIIFLATFNIIFLSKQSNMAKIILRPVLQEALLNSALLEDPCRRETSELTFWKIGKIRDYVNRDQPSRGGFLVQRVLS